MNTQEIIKSLREIHRATSDAGRVLAPLKQAGIITDDKASLTSKGARFATVSLSDVSHLSDEEKNAARKACKDANLANALRARYGLASVHFDNVADALESAAKRVAELEAQVAALSAPAKVKKAA